jgi:hypothetical protein
MTLREGLLFAGLALGLTACQSNGFSSLASFNAPPDGMPVSVESIDGPPEMLQAAIIDELASAAARNDIDLVTDGAPARYHVRGYVTADRTNAGKAALAYVWDVFDAEKRRAVRVSGSSALKEDSGDSWERLDKEALAKLAADSMAEIASFLAGSRTNVATAPSDAVTPEPAMSYASP